MKIKTVFVVAALSGLVRGTEGGTGGLKQFPCRGRAREMIYCSAFDTFR